MNEEIGKFPTEIFGHYYKDNSISFLDDLSNQFCPYLNGECKKPRKSEPLIKVGMCSVGYKGTFLKSYKPVIICPHRFLENNLFKALENLYLKEYSNIKWISEVNIGVGGNIDFVAIDQDPITNEIKDFLCIELQAAGTTGSPWPAMIDLKTNGSYLSKSYNYGINWANEFMKTMMQQVYKKGKILKHWNRKIVFVIQDVAMEYLHSEVDTSDLREANDNDEIHFVMFSMVWENNSWKLKFKNALSTDLNGINKILSGANKDSYLTENEFISNIISKQKQSK